MTKLEHIEIRILELTAQIEALSAEHLKTKMDLVASQNPIKLNFCECQGHDCKNFGTTECQHCED
jgi:hypothetical protein